MGKNDRARRAAKAKTRRRASGHAGAHYRGFQTGHASDTRRPAEGPDALSAEAIRGLLMLASEPSETTDPVTLQCIEALSGASPDVVDREAETLIVAIVAQLWTGGWQPFELQRQGRLGCANAAGARLVGAAIANDHANRRSVTLHPRWVAQIESLELPHADGRAGWIRRWIISDGLDRTVAVTAMVDVLVNLRHLPRLDPILPPPGSGDQPPSPSPFTEHSGPEGAESDPTLQRIRNLLAKAESTTFEAEAMAFTAKAQELMTRHAIDAALVHSRGRGDDHPIAIRVPIDAPYVDPKSLLLQTVASAGRCRAVFLPVVSLSTVVGFRDDVAAVELLFTSLLVQAQTAMTDAAKRAPAGSRPRSQAFRSAFLAGYTNRIDARLREINEAVYAEVEAQQGAAFLPVLRSRSAAIDDFVADRFGKLVSSPRRRYFDAAGWTSGTVAADNAHLSAGEFAEP